MQAYNCWIGILRLWKFTLWHLLHHLRHYGSYTELVLLNKIFLKKKHTLYAIGSRLESNSHVLDAVWELLWSTLSSFKNMVNPKSYNCAFVIPIAHRNPTHVLHKEKKTQGSLSQSIALSYSWYFGWVDWSINLNFKVSNGDHKIQSKVKIIGNHSLVLSIYCADWLLGCKG